MNNNQYMIIMVMILIAIGFFFGAIYLLFLRRDTVTERLDKFASPDKHKTAPKKQGLFSEVTKSKVAHIAKSLHGLDSPSDSSRKKKIRYKLMQAGFPTKQAYYNYLAAKVILAILLPTVYLFWQLTIANSYMLVPILTGLLFGGYLIPNVIILEFKQKRQQTIVKSMPDALDLMTICVAAGLGLDMTFRRVGEEIREFSKHLSDEFLMTNLEIRAGLPREESYRNLSERTDVPDVRSLVSMLIQTSKFGTSLSDSLRILSDDMRIKRRQLAEEKAAKNAVKIMLPLIMFIFPTLFIIIVGPAAIRVARTLLPAMGGG